MRTITNDYRDARVMNLGSGSERGPYLVTQTGVAPRAERPRTQMFVLRPDGHWVDFNAYACQGKPEAMRCKTRNAVVGKKEITSLNSITRPTTMSSVSQNQNIDHYDQTRTH